MEDNKPRVVVLCLTDAVSRAVASLPSKGQDVLLVIKDEPPPTPEPLPPLFDPLHLPRYCKKRTGRKGRRYR